MAAASWPAAGNAAPSAKASNRLVVPAAKPLMQATQEASFSATLRVKLLSSAQNRQASTTASAGQSDATAWPRSKSFCGQLSISAPATIATMPRAMRLPRFSLNTIHASSVVNTASALSSKAA